MQQDPKRFHRLGHGSPSVSGFGRSRTCTTPIKSRQLSLLSYEAKGVTGRDLNLRRLAFQTSALPLSYGHEE